MLDHEPGVAAARGEFGEHLLHLARQSSPLFQSALAAYGDATIGEFLAAFAHEPAEPAQPRDDLWAVVEEQASAYYGEAVARAAVAELRADPTVPTANHFGVDTFADSVQGTLLWGMRPRRDGRPRDAVVVFGCGSVSLDNLTYPMGLRLYDPRQGRLDALPQRLPVLPNRLRRSTVGAVGPFDEGMVRRARERLRAMRRVGDVTATCEAAAGRILDEDFLAPGVLGLPTYGHQSTAVNGRLWSRLFRDGSPPAPLVQLHLEAICAALLARDLTDPGSLAHRVLFEPAVRDAVLRRLDGARACWRLDRLRDGLGNPGAVAGEPPRDGTVFFWGLTPSGKRFPLVPVGLDALPRLAGVDDTGAVVEFPLAPVALAEALAAGRLTPSLLTAYVVLSFARGVACVGGYYQVSYLPVMQAAVASAVAAVDPAQAAAVARVPTTMSMAGIQFAARQLPDGAAIPAGPVEFAGAGGMTASDVARIPGVSMREANLAAFPDVFHDLVPDAGLPPDWLDRIARENARACPSLVRLHDALA